MCFSALIDAAENGLRSLLLLKIMRAVPLQYYAYYFYEYSLSKLQTEHSSAIESYLPGQLESFCK